VVSFIEEKSGMSLSDVSVECQLFLIDYLMKSTNEQANIFYSFLNIFKVDGTKTFLSIEHGGKMGPKYLLLQSISKIVMKY
jgi:hypothetical protein